MATRDKKRKLSAVTPSASAADVPAARVAGAETSKPRRLAATTATAAKSEPAAEATTTTQPTPASAATTAASALAVPLAFTRQSVEANARAVTAAAIAATSRQRTSDDGDGADGEASSRGSTVDVDTVFRDAKMHFLTSDEASWVYHVPRWYRHLYRFCFESTVDDALTESASESKTSTSVSFTSRSKWFDAVWQLHPKHHDTIKMFGRDVLTPRFQQAYGVSYRFSGNTFDALPVPGVLQHCVETMQAIVTNPETRASYLRGALVNWYSDGEHYIGPHSDSESSLFKHSPVFSLSLGATRRFVFTTKADSANIRGDSTASGNATAARVCKRVSRLELELQDGDLVIMGGSTQQTHKHALPKMKKCLGKRVSITLRCFK